jgi:hypothetical protein
MDLNICRNICVLRLLWQMIVAQWRAQKLGGDLGAHPMSSSPELHIIGSMRSLESLSASILVSLLLYFQLEHFIIYVFLL